jgi:PAS domain S-box-containing protein
MLTQVSVAEPLIQASLLGEAVDHGPALVFVADENMRYVAVSARACAELGYTREELVGLSVTDVARAETAAADYRAMMERRGGEGEATLTRKDGSTVTVRFFAGETVTAGMQFYISFGFVLA